MVGGETLLVIALELLDEVADEPVAKVLVTKFCVTGSGFDIQGTLFNNKQRDIAMPSLYLSPLTKRIFSSDLEEKHA